MSQSPIRTEQNETERGGLPMVLPENGGDLHEGWLSRVMRILFGWRGQATRAELELVLTAEQPESGFSPTEATMLKNILGLRECRIESVMVPRADIIAVQQDITIGELVKVFAGAAHSRLVVYNDTLDDPVGMVHIRDLLGFMAARAAIEPAAADKDQSPATDLDLGKIDLTMPLKNTKIARDILYAPPSMPALDLLAKMQATRIHLALIIDEYGGSDGLVSMEDLVELIVGDIAPASTTCARWSAKNSTSAKPRRKSTRSAAIWWCAQATCRCAGNSFPDRQPSRPKCSMPIRAASSA
jgi:CBS domain